MALVRQCGVIALAVVAGACVPRTRVLVRPSPVGEPRVRIGDVVHVRRASDATALLRGPLIAASDSNLTITALDPTAADTAGLGATRVGTAAVRVHVPWGEVASVAMPLDIVTARGIPYTAPPARTSTVIRSSTGVLGVVLGVTCGVLAYRSLSDLHPSFEGLNLMLATIVGGGCATVVAFSGNVAADAARAVEGPGDPGRWVVIPSAREQVLQPGASAP